MLRARDQQKKLLATKTLRLLKSLIVMLTAALQPLLEGEFKAIMIVRYATYVRVSTVRLNA